jgi:hypothetical protein
LEDNMMDDSGIQKMVPPTADIGNLHQELEQLFAGTQNGSRVTSEEKTDAPKGPSLVIKGK